MQKGDPPDPSPSISIHLGGSAPAVRRVTAQGWRPVEDGEPPLFHPCVEYKLHVTESTTVPVEQVSFYFWNDNNNKKPFVDTEPNPGTLHTVLSLQRCQLSS